MSSSEQQRKIHIGENQVMADLNINPPRPKIARRQATCDIAEAMTLTALEELNIRLRSDKGGNEEGITMCKHCSKAKQNDKNAKFKICTCCDKLRSSLLVPVPNANSNLEALITELCGTNTEVTFSKIKDQFLAENYPNIQEGMHIHPDIFVTNQKNHGFPEPGKETSEDKGSISELKVRDFLKEQFKDEDCFIFHTFTTGLDRKVVDQLCDQMTEKLDADESTLKEVETRMRTIANLTFPDWDVIVKEARKKIEVRRSKKKRLDFCRSKIKVFKQQLFHKIHHEKDFIVVCRALRAIIHIEAKSSGPQIKEGKKQIFMLKRFLEELQLPDMAGAWSLLGFVAVPDVTVEEAEQEYFSKSQNNCDQCKKHVLLKEDFEEGKFYAHVKKLIEEESSVTKSNYHDSTATKRMPPSGSAQKAREKMLEYLEKAEDTRQTFNYIQLISNMLVLSNMDLMPHSTAVEKVMEQLTGIRKNVVGPADSTASKHLGLYSYKNLKKHNAKRKQNLGIWNRDQMKHKMKKTVKAIITGDFSVGKSVVLHHQILACCRPDQKKPDQPKNFLISFSQDTSNSFPMRGILDISNRLRYEKEGIDVIDSRDILHPKSSLRSRLKLPLPDSSKDDIFTFLFDLTERYPDSNIAVDEVPRDLLVQKQQVHHHNFKGSLWLAVSSVALCDFRDQNDTAHLSEIPVFESQHFQNIHLTKNMRNGSRILEGSLNLHEEGTIEKGTVVTKPMNRRLSKSKTALKQAIQHAMYGDNDIKSDSDSKGYSDSESESDSDSETIKARIVKEGKDAVYINPKPDSEGCPTIPGEYPRVLKGEEGVAFMTETLLDRCRNQENIVVLGNDHTDVAWIVKCLTESGQFSKDLLTVYNPQDEKDIATKEQNLVVYLQTPRGCLVTKGSLFEGMESATVILVYSNPYSSHFRRNYLRAAVELVLIDRSILGTAQINPLQHQNKLPMLPCPHCREIFDRPSLLKRHICLHTGERPHVCQICQKGFFTSSSLNTHIRIHTGEKPHKCEVCSKTYTTLSNLRFHKMTHIQSS